MVTIGIFDGVHTGHLLILDKLKEIAAHTGGESVVITLWPHPRMVLQPGLQNLRLLTTMEEKQELLASKGIDQLVIIPFTPEFSQLTSCVFIRQYLVEQIGMHHFVVGFNHHFGKDREGDIEKIRECARDYHFTLEKLDARQVGGLEVSSSLIREWIEKGDIEGANRLLGYTYSLSGTVVDGNRLGRSIGFPTANIKPAEAYKLVPPSGVYAVKVLVDGNTYGGMLNIGIRPTLDTGNKHNTIEVNIFGLDQDLYGKAISVAFHRKLREEMKFPDLERLRQQLETDRINALNVLQN